MFRVPIASLPVGLHESTERTDALALGLDPDTFSDIEIDLRLTIGHRRVLAAFDARATARLTCDRTLDLFDLPIGGAHSVLFLAPEIAPDEVDDEAVQVLPADATDLDLTEPVRDTLLLAVPLRRVSPAAEAIPLPLSFGAPEDDEPQNDPWSALRALRPDPEAPDSTD
jgi:uncharacterized protein